MRIEIGPHYSKLLDPPDEPLEDLIRKALSYELPGAEFTKQKFIRRGGRVKFNPRYQADSVKYLYDKRSRKFPTGLLSKVLELIPDAQVSRVLNPIVPNSSYVLADQNRTPRYYQHDAWRTATTSPSQRGVIILPTGTGKTLLCSMLVSSYPDQNILVTVPNLNLLNQSKEEMETILGFPVGILGDNECDIKRVTVATIQSLVSKSHEPFIAAFLKSAGVWISDECHGTAADSYLDLSKLLVNCDVRFGVTATWMREDGKEMIMGGVLGDVLYEYTLQQAMSDGFLTPVSIILRHINHIVKPSSKKPTYKQVYKEAITMNDIRSGMYVAQDVSNLVDAGMTPCLVIVDEIEHGNRLSKILGAPFISGKETNRQKRKQMLDDFANGRFPVLVGSSVMNVGVDVPTIKSMVNAAGGKSLTLLLQRIGRSLRKHPTKQEVIYVDYIDHHPNYIESHANLRKYFYNTYFTKVKEITSEPII